MKSFLLSPNGERPSLLRTTQNAALDLDAMFKIKSLLYKDLILNSLSAMLMAMSKK